jgi:hypothetical protein
MSEYLSRDVHPCSCGKLVAWLRTKEGGIIPYDICGEVTTEPDGSKRVVVSTSDYHYCYMYPGIAKFIGGRSSAAPGGHLHIRLPVNSRDPMVLTYRKGDKHARISNGRSGKREKPYGWINVENGGYRVRAQSSPLKELLDLLNERPVNFDWSRNRSQTECCFCGRELIDEHSVMRGYGPTCAAKYGMPR